MNSRLFNRSNCISAAPGQADSITDLAMIVRGSLRCGIATRLMSAWGH
jgi:hypothetical protein